MNVCTDDPAEGSQSSPLLSPCPWPLSGKLIRTVVPPPCPCQPVEAWGKVVPSNRLNMLPLEPSPVFWMQLVQLAFFFLQELEEKILLASQTAEEEEKAV